MNSQSLRYYWEQPSIEIYTISEGTHKHIIENVGVSIMGKMGGEKYPVKCPLLLFFQVGRIPSSVYFFVQESKRYEGKH